MMTMSTTTIRVVGATALLILAVWDVSGQSHAARQISEEAALARQLAGGGSIDPAMGYSVFSVVGWNPSVGNGFENMWSAGGTQPKPPKIGLIMSVRSTSANDTSSGGTGAQTVTITCHGPNAVPFTEAIAMNGEAFSTPMANVCVRVITFGVTESGVLGTNDGTISLENAGTVYSEIPVLSGLGLGILADGLGAALSASYTCPAGRVCVIIRAFWTTGDNQAVFTAGFIADLLTEGRRASIFEIGNDAQVQIGQCFPPGTDINVVVRVPTGTAALAVTYRVHELPKKDEKCPPGRSQIGIN